MLDAGSAKTSNPWWPKHHRQRGGPEEAEPYGAFDPASDQLRPPPSVCQIRLSVPRRLVT